LRRSDLKNRPAGLWRYREFFPFVKPGNIVSLGEGGTSIQEAGNLARTIGLNRLFLKQDFLNPTGSFKDRGSTVLVSRAKELGIGSVADDSSGNAGSSISAYCAKAGIKCTIYVPASAPEGKLTQISMYGAHLVKVQGSRSDVSETIEGLWRSNKIYYASHNLSPFFLEGMKSLACEVAEQMNWEVPDHVVFPAGSGTLLIGAWKGFESMRRLDWTAMTPSIHAVQSEACMPIVSAFRSGLPHVEPAKEADTIAGGIRIANPVRGKQVLEVLRQTNGSAVSVSDAEILQYERLLAQQEGIFAEPTSCAAIAGLARLVKEGTINRDESVVVPLTGFGLKDLKSAAMALSI